MFEALIQYIIQYVHDNFNEEITGDSLQGVLRRMVTDLGVYEFRGIATLTTDPGPVTAPALYVSVFSGTFTNFNNLVVPSHTGIVFIKYDVDLSAWTYSILDMGTHNRVHSVTNTLDHAAVPAGPNRGKILANLAGSGAIYWAAISEFVDVLWQRSIDGYLTPTHINDKLGLGVTLPTKAIDIDGGARFRNLQNEQIENTTEVPVLDDDGNLSQQTIDTFQMRMWAFGQILPAVSDREYYGETIKVNISEGSNFRVVLVQKSDFSFMVADALASGVMVMALSTATGEQPVLIRGMVYKDTWSFTKGFIWADDFGNVTQTDTGLPPIGFALNATTMWFEPGKFNATAGIYNHPIYDPFDINTIGGEVITQITTDDIGSVQHVGTRQLVPGDIGAAYEEHTHDYDNYQAWKLYVDESDPYYIFNHNSNLPSKGVKFVNGGGITIFHEVVNNLLAISFENADPFQFLKIASGVSNFDLYNQETLNLIAGQNITITPNSTTKSVTIAATPVDGYIAWALAVDSSAAVLIYKNGSNINYQGVRFKAGTAIQINQANGSDKFSELTIVNTKPFDQFNIKVGGTQAFAILNLEALNLIAGANVTITPNSGNKSVTISASTGDNYEAWSFDINGSGSVLIYKNASGSTFQGVRLLSGDGINITAAGSADKFAVATIENTKPFDQFNIKVNGTQAFAVLNLEALNLIAGSNVTITPNAGNKSVTIAASAGSTRAYKRAVLIESDFYSATAYAVPGIVGAAISSGTVSGASVDGKHPGTVILKDSTTANGGYQYMTERYAFLLNTTNTDYIVHYEATLIFKMTNVTATTILRFGFFDSANVGATPTYGYYMEVVCNGSTFNCKLRCYNSSLINSVDGTVNLSANTWYRAVLTIGRDSLGIYATLIIYNESNVVLTSTGLYQLPQLSSVCGFGVQAGETTTSAVANLAYIDYMKLDGNIELTR